MAWLSRSFEWDPRSLRLLSLLLGARMACEAADAACNRELFLSDRGLVPRADVLAASEPAAFNIYLAAGGWAVWPILACHFACGVAIALRLWMPLPVLVGYVFQCSLVDRLDLLTVGGLDNAYKSLLLWTLVLPIEEDSSWPRANLHLLSLHLSLIYCASGWLKTGWEWSDGSAIYIVLGTSMARDNLVVALLRQSPWLCYLLTKGALALERYGWLALWIPLPAVRALAAVAFAGLHIGIHVTVDVLDFHLVMLPALAAILPSSAWDALAEPLAHRARRWLQSRRFCLPLPHWAKILWSRLLLVSSLSLAASSGVPRSGAHVSPREKEEEQPKFDVERLHKLPQAMRRRHQVLLLTLSIVAWFLSICTVARSVARYADGAASGLVKQLGRCGLNQPLDMFAPRPSNPDAWVAVYGETRRGEVVDCMPGGSLLGRWAPVQPEDLRSKRRRPTAHHRLRKFFRPERFNQQSRGGASLCRFLCGRGAGAGQEERDDVLRAVAVYRFLRQVEPNLTEDVRSPKLQYSCACPPFPESTAAAFQQTLERAAA